MRVAADLEIVSCAEWGAAAPRGRVSLGRSRPSRIIFHHTAGHAGATGEQYARAIQRDHMGRGYVDSGHNFLVLRDGRIFEGRHGSIAAARGGRAMVVSAHCPGENDQPGIEHEHLGDEQLTPAQRASSIALMAWLCRQYGIRPSSGIRGHREFFPTACPSDALQRQLPELRLAVARALSSSGSLRRPAPSSAPSPLPGWWWAWAAWRIAGGASARPRNVPATVPLWAWRRLVSFLLKRERRRRS